MTAESFDGLVDRIYEAAVVPELWPAVFEDMACLTESAFGSMYAMRAGTVRWIGTPAADELIAAYGPVAHLYPNPRPERGKEVGVYGFAADQDFMDVATLKDDPFYRGFLYPRGYGWFAGTIFSIPSGDLLYVSVERRFERGPFERHHVNSLDALRPHLGRAAFLSARLSLERARAATQALEAVGLPAAVLQRGGRLQVANPLFAALIPDVAQDRRERLCLSDVAADKLFRDALLQMDVGTDHREVRSIPVAARDGRAPAIVHVIPVRLSAHDIFTQASALVAITSVDRAAVPTAEVLQGLFDLTRAEARIARGIGEAKSVEQLAAALGISRETVRVHLKAVLGKTGLNRQAELANLLSGLALPR